MLASSFTVRDGPGESQTKAGYPADAPCNDVLGRIRLYSRSVQCVKSRKIVREGAGQPVVGVLVLRRLRCLANILPRSGVESRTMSVRAPAQGILIAAWLIVGCDGSQIRSSAGAGSPASSPDPEQTLSVEDREILDGAKRKAAELRELRADPSGFVEMGEWNAVDNGLINTYSRATSAELTNLSSFDVRDISGEFIYIDKNGAIMAKVPVSFEGELLAGETKKMKVRARNISGKAEIARLIVTNLTVRE